METEKNYHDEEEEFLGPKLPRADKTTDDLIIGCLIMLILAGCTIFAMIMMAKFNWQ